MQPKNSIRRKPAFPDGMLIVLGVIKLCVIVTWFIPSGQYDRILDASGRQIVDPNSFHYIESEKISLLRIPHFIVEGTIAQAEMIFFLLTIGGCYEIVMHTGVLQAIIARMAKWKVRAGVCRDRSSCWRCSVFHRICAHFCHDRPGHGL